jgi:hypothetical protein
MPERFIPLKDSRRNRRGNRTIKISFATWQDLQKKKCWPDANTVLRDVCRVSALHLPPEHDQYGDVTRARFGGAAELVYTLIHGSHFMSTPMEQRKKYASVIRLLILKQRDQRLRIRGFLKPGQPTCRIP